MPFPWKKAKVNRISRLVADLHQSPKRGGSLVVETGFPTSLIDLFVKNQDRLRKSSRRKSSSSPAPEIPPPPNSPPKSSPSSPPCVQQVRSLDIDVGKSVLVERAECDERIAFHPAVKVFLVVALAVSTRNLALWIVTAAFLLVLLEFVGARYFSFLRPQSLMLFLGSWLKKALLVLKKKWDWNREQGSLQVLIAKQQQQQQQQQQQEPEVIVFYDRVEEIQIEESNLDSMDEGCERIGEILEKSGESSIFKSERCSSRERIKANLIRKLKKLRKGKKKKKSHEKEDQSGPDISLDKSDKIKDEGADHESGLQEVEVEIEVEEEEESCKQVVEEKEKVAEGKGFVTVMLLGVVLAGLLGGRGLSLLLTLVCCLVVRYSSSTPIRLGMAEMGSCTSSSSSALLSQSQGSS